MSDLLPCPFCGGEAAHGTITYSDKTVKYQKWDQSVFYKVNCIICGANNLGLVGHITPEKAAENWNKRKEAADEIDRLTAENAALKKDAERIDWLEREKRVIYLVGQSMDETVWAVSKTHATGRKSLREAIDAAIGKTKEGV